MNTKATLPEPMIHVTWIQEQNFNGYFCYTCTIKKNIDQDYGMMDPFKYKYFVFR